MKVFRIKSKDADTEEIIEVNEAESLQPLTSDEDEPSTASEPEVNTGLSNEELDSLKRLASVADKLIALVEEKHDADEPAVPTDEPVTEPVAEPISPELPDEGEKITDSLASSKRVVRDSVPSFDLDEKWSKRYSK